MIKSLCDEAGVKYEAIYRVTTIDPPPLIGFIREHHPEVKWERSRKGPFLSRLKVRGFPLRQQRWCCEEFKHPAPRNRTTVVGVRGLESTARRENWAEVMGDAPPEKVCPIYTWSDDDVWHYIHDRDLPYCSLYDDGWKRIGCLFCPFESGGNKLDQTKRFPAFTKAFIRAFERLHAHRKSQGRGSVDRWRNGEEMFWWWIRED